jgi:hypothetical protein
MAAVLTWAMIVGMRRAARAVSTVLAAVVLAGCAGQPGTGTPVDEGEWTTYQADVTGVRASDDPRSLLLDVAVLAGADGCSRDPRIGYYTEENNLIYANVVQDSRRAGVVGGCPTHAAAVVKLTSPEPINGRRVVLNEEPWKPVGGSYQRCDKTFGCDPRPADHCDPAWVHAAVAGLDVSRHSTGHVEGCDGSWLVMTVPDDPVPCGAEARPGCVTTANVRRYFMRWAEGSGWSTIVTSTQAGCGTVAKTEPRFPRELCARLPRP